MGDITLVDNFEGSSDITVRVEEAVKGNTLAWGSIGLSMNSSGQRDSMDATADEHAAKKAVERLLRGTIWVVEKVERRPNAADGESGFAWHITFADADEYPRLIVDAMQLHWGASAYVSPEQKSVYATPMFKTIEYSALIPDASDYLSSMVYRPDVDDNFFVRNRPNNLTVKVESYSSETGEGSKTVEQEYHVYVKAVNDLPDIAGKENILIAEDEALELFSENLITIDDVDWEDMLGGPYFTVRLETDRGRLQVPVGGKGAVRTHCDSERDDPNPQNALILVITNPLICMADSALSNADYPKLRTRLRRIGIHVHSLLFVEKLSA